MSPRAGSTPGSAGPTIDPMSKEADYDPQSAAISSAYVSAFNDYVRTALKFGEHKTYKAGIDVEKLWDMLHQPPGAADQGCRARSMSCRISRLP